jgi:Delta7-sterol 5-desaturase
MSFFAAGLVLLIKAGKTKMYFSIETYGWFYLVASSVIFILAYDTYFYWLHRFMHLKKVFPLVHRLHHLSHTPSPWAILAFNPLEAILEFLIYPLVILLIPLHPLAVLIFVFHNIVLNTLGHVGYEIVPRSFFKNPVLGIGLTVTHHDMHHRKVRYNFGIYFNIWDRIMGTNHPEYETTYQHVKNKSKPE